MTSFLASKALRSTVAAVPPGRRPAPFDAAGFGGALYRVEEPVLDMTSLLAALARPLPARIRRAEVAALETGGAGGGMRLSLPGGVVVDAARVVVAAGEGAPQAAAALGVRAPAMQRRPLHMVAVEHAGAPPLFGHCIGTGAKPAVTVTTHPAPAGRQVWYLGGDLAETGVTRSPQQQIAAARDLLARTLPFVTLANPRWASLRIDRAEPATEAGARPDTAFAAAEGPLVVAWPTKMTLAPDLADQVLSLLPPPRGGDAAIMAAAALPAPAVARPFWEEG